MAENMVIRRIFRPMMEDVSRWKYLRNYELRNLYCSPYIRRVMKSRRMGLEGHVVRMREEINAYKILASKLKEWDHLEVLKIYENVIKRIIKNSLGGCERDSLATG
jgi:hypothetical protein